MFCFKCGHEIVDSGVLFCSECGENLGKPPVQSAAVPPSYGAVPPPYGAMPPSYGAVPPPYGVAPSLYGIGDDYGNAVVVGSGGTLDMANKIRAYVGAALLFFALILIAINVGEYTNGFKLLADAFDAVGYRAEFFLVIICVLGTLIFSIVGIICFFATETATFSCVAGSVSGAMGIIYSMCVGRGWTAAIMSTILCIVALVLSLLYKDLNLYIDDDLYVAHEVGITPGGQPILNNKPVERYNPNSLS